MPTVRSGADVLAGHVEPPFSDAPIRLVHGEPITLAEAVGFIVHDMWGYPFNDFVNSMRGNPTAPVSEAIWQCRNKYTDFLPEEIANAKYLRELLDAILAFSASWLKERKTRT